MEELLTNDGVNMDWNDPSWWVTKGVHVETVKAFSCDKVEIYKKMHAHNFVNVKTSNMSPIHQTSKELKKSIPSLLPRKHSSLLQIYNF